MNNKSLSWFGCLVETLKECLTNWACMSFFLVAIGFYSVYYAWPYMNQLPDHIKTVIVDLDQTPVSRNIVRELQATEQLDVIALTNSAESARKVLQNGTTSAIITIPEKFTEHALTRIPTAIEMISAGSFIVKARATMSGIAGPLQQALSSAIGTQLIEQGIPADQVARISQQPPALIIQPMYNTLSGYLNFAVPIVMCIIFQTAMVAGTGMLLNDWFTRKSVPTVLKQVIQNPLSLFAVYLALVLICVFWTLFIEGWSFAWHGVNSFQNIPATLATCVLLSMSVISLGLLIGFLLKEHRYIVQAVVISSIPCVFITGDLFPYQNIPDYMNLAAYFLPSTHAIHAMIRASQAGASIGEIIPHLLNLTFLTALYFVLALLRIRSIRGQYSDV